jgi:hypothetical protein
MATFEFKYNASIDVQQQEFSLLPEDWYNAQIISSEIKPTKDGGGAYLQLTYKIIDGKHSGRQVIDRLNVHNKNKIAEDIGKRRLNSMLGIMKIEDMKDTQQLHGFPLKIKIIIRKDKTGQYSDTNEVKIVKACDNKIAEPAWAGKTVEDKKEDDGTPPWAK